MPNYYPIMLDVRGRSALVIGGDRVAAEKASALHDCGAQVTVMSSEFCEELLDLERSHRVMLRYKAYEHGDLLGVFVVVATATYQPELAEAIWQEAQENGQLINIVDLPARCNFILPSILRRGALTIGVSTEGTSPGMAKRIRQRLETLFPPSYTTYMRIAAVARVHLKERGISYAQRDDFFEDFFTSDILDLLTEGDEVEALTSTVSLLQRYHVDVSVASIINDLQKVEESNGRDDPA